GKVSVNGGTSSQFMSALLLISPILESGIEVHLQGEVVSRPYINMTVELLKKYGLEVTFVENKISVAPFLAPLKRPSIKVESDWSSALYWYSLAALSKQASIRLSSFHEKSLQADSVLPGIFDQLGVKTEFAGSDIVLSNGGAKISRFEYDFVNCPDIAQT